MTWTTASGVYLTFAARPYWFRAPFCDCPGETCPECWREGRTIGWLTSGERDERIERMNVRLGHVKEDAGDQQQRTR